MKRFKFGSIGFGNMASAIIKGIVGKGILLPSDIAIFDKSDVSISNANTIGINVLESNQQICDNCEYVLLAVKPQIFSEIANSTKFSADNIVISIMAGIKIERIIEEIGIDNVIRCMPNLPAMIREGATSIDFSHVAPHDKFFVKSVFESVSLVVELDEKFFDAVTAISGSGPAYVYLFIDALAKAGIKIGLGEDIAVKLAVQTFIGASKMSESSIDPLSVLIDRVCSKGGTTIQAVDSFNNDNIYGIIEKAVKACYNRSVELSK